MKPVVFCEEDEIELLFPWLRPDDASKEQRHSAASAEWEPPTQKVPVVVRVIVLGG